LYAYVGNNPIDGSDPLGFETRWVEEWTGEVDRWRERVVGWTDWDTYDPTYGKTDTGICYKKEAQFRVEMIEKWGFKTKTRWQESRSWAYKYFIPVAGGLKAARDFYFSEARLALAAAELALDLMRDKVIEKGAEVVLEHTGWHEVPGTRTPPFRGGGIMTKDSPESLGAVDHRDLYTIIPCPCP
jgi:hypothetical protein